METTTQTRKTYVLEVMLSDDFRRTCGGYDPDAPYRRATVVMFRTPSVNEALDAAYAVCNSYPEEMFCAEEWREVVTEYRADRNRSLSVGDVIQVRVQTEGVGETDADEGLYSCEAFGWEKRS